MPEAQLRVSRGLVRLQDQMGEAGGVTERGPSVTMTMNAWVDKNAVEVIFFGDGCHLNGLHLSLN